MKGLRLTITLPGTLILAVACAKATDEPSRPSTSPVPTPAAAQAPAAAQPPRVPTPLAISPVAVPRRFSTATYFLYGRGLGVGVTRVLSGLLDGGLPVLDAWYPQGAVCMAPLPDQLIVQLTGPDARIEAMGFTRDSTGVMVDCFAHWLHYDFRSTR